MKRGPVDLAVEFSTLVEALRWRALQQPEQRIYTYLIDGELEGAQLTYAALDCQARAIGALLQSYKASGERALLLYPTGLEFIAAFFGCLYAGVIARAIALKSVSKDEVSKIRVIPAGLEPFVLNPEFGA